MSLIRFEDVTKCLEVEALDEGRFGAPHIEMPYYRIFGGQLLAQAIAVASRSATPKIVKSMHVTFPLAGDLRKPLEYRVERLQDGRTFANRFIRAVQEDRAICSASILLHEPEAGLSHQMTAPDVGRPQDAAAVDLSMIPWETRAVEGVDLESRETGPPEYALWMRTPTLSDDPVVHQALLAHATDLTLIGTALRPHPDLCEADSPELIQTAVNTHSLWFHKPFRLDDWVLLSQHSPVAAGGRVFGSGHCFDAEGELVASYAQEAMVRLVEDSE